MGMPAWGTAVTVVASVVMSYGLGALMATTAQNMAMPSAMVLQLIFGFLLPGQGEANIVSAAVSNAIVRERDVKRRNSTGGGLESGQCISKGTHNIFRDESTAKDSGISVGSMPMYLF